MEKDEFKELLKKAELNKKELAERMGLPYGSVNNWGVQNPFPKWVKSWLQNYIKLKTYEKIEDLKKNL